jgi:hypothetical protein
MAAAPTADRPSIVVTSSDSRRVTHGEGRPLERSSPFALHTARGLGCSPDGAQDAVVAPVAAPAGQLGPHGGGEGVVAHGHDLAGVAAHRHGCPPGGRRLQRLGRSAQHRRPYALEQIAQALAGGARLDELVVAAGSQVAQPAPVALERVGHVTVPVGHTASDDRRVLEIRAVPGEVLLLATPVDQHGVDADHFDASSPAALQHRLPAVPGGFTADHHSDEAGLHGDGQRPVQDLVDDPRVTVEHPPAKGDRVVVGDDRDLLGGGQVDADDGQIGSYDRPQAGQLLVASPVTARERPRVGHSSLLGVVRTGTRTLARGMLRVVDPDSTSTGTY